ncbi:uncharacterized protein LOC143635891 [Bidens hawaiensis]|uniref:uncharacterized protein LOC143635891 n=1 Tax=Bidens hawaiensis TaxID=980011 RepID=UPI0040499273
METLEELEKLETAIKHHMIIKQDQTNDLNRPIHGEGSSNSNSNSNNEETTTFRVLSTKQLQWLESNDELIYELRKPLDLSECDIVSRRSVEERVLIEALRAAVALDLKRVVLYCDYYPLYQFVSGQWRPKQQKIINFLDQVNLLRKSFTYCQPSFIARKDVKFAFKLAREATSSEISNATSSQEKLENCVICLDDKSIDQFFAVEGCTHRYCYSCVKQQVEVKLLNGVLPKCPHEGCENELRFESCEKFLNPKFTEMMRERLKEDSIPVTEKVYCPYPKCSALMSKTEVLKLPGMINEVGAIRCYKCHGNFCISCRVPWHNDMNCAEYKSRNPTLIVEESKLKSLAARNLWRQCVKCKHMIELAAGCYHMTCRCGYEFCYTCGAEWKNKKATCTCPLWDEEHIMDIEEEEDEDDDFEHNFILQNDNFGHNVFREDDDFGHNVPLEDNFGGDVALEDDDFGHNVVHENDVFEDGGFGHDVVLEGDDFENDNVHENDDFEEEVLLDDVHENDNFEDEALLEDDVLDEEQEQDECGNDLEDGVYDDFGHNVPLEDNFGGDVALEDDDFGHNVVHENDVFEDDGFGHDVVLEGDDFENDNVHENDDFEEEVLLDDDVHENDNFEDEALLEDDVLDEEQEQDECGNDLEDGVYDDFGHNVPLEDNFGGDVALEDDDFGHNVVHENDVFEDDGFGHDVVLEGDDFENDNVHENDDFEEEVLLDDDVHENDNFEDEALLEDDVLDEQQEQDDCGNDLEDGVYDDFGNHEDVYDDYGDDVDVYDDYGDGEDVYDNDYYF